MTGQSVGLWRRGATSVAAVAMAALMAGCGAAAEPAPSVAAAPTGDAFPVTIEHSLGTTTIETEPRRVVTVGYTDQDAVLALGVVPVATTEWFGDQPGALYPWAAAELRGAPLPQVLPTANPVPIEQIAALDPDLILSVYGGLKQEDYDKLVQIAPTVTQPEGVQSYGATWDVQTEIIGRALGRSAEADRLVSDIQSKIDSVRQDYPQFAGRTAVAVTWNSDGWYVYSGKDARGQLLTSLGFTVPTEIDQLAGERFGAPLSFERGDLLDVDAQVWLPVTPADEQAIRSSPGYATSRAATEGRSLFVPFGAGTDLDPMSGYLTVLSVSKLLDVLPGQLAAVVDGDPATTPPALTPSS